MGSVGVGGIGMHNLSREEGRARRGTSDVSAAGDWGWNEGSTVLGGGVWTSVSELLEVTVTATTTQRKS